MKRNPRRYVLVGSIALILLALGGYGVWQYLEQKNTPPVSVRPAFVCTDAIVEKANPIIANNDLTAYAKLVDSIKSKDGYERDVNCQYIVARYSLAISDVTQAKKSIDAIRTLQDTKGYGYNTNFEPQAMSPNELDTVLDGVKANQATMEKQNGDTTYGEK